MAGVAEQDSPIDIESCAREPVHIIGHIQSHGLLFALSEPDFIVRQVSANVDAVLGVATSDVLGRSLTDEFTPYGGSHARAVLARRVV